MAQVAVGNLVFLAEQVQILLDRTVPIGALLAGPGEGSPGLPDLVGHGGIADQFVPGLQRILTGDEGGALAVVDDGRNRVPELLGQEMIDHPVDYMHLMQLDKPRVLWRKLFNFSPNHFLSID